MYWLAHEVINPIWRAFVSLNVIIETNEHWIKLHFHLIHSIMCFWEYTNHMKKPISIKWELGSCHPKMNEGQYNEAHMLTGNNYYLLHSRFWQLMENTRKFQPENQFNRRSIEAGKQILLHSDTVTWKYRNENDNVWNKVTKCWHHIAYSSFMLRKLYCFSFFNIIFKMLKILFTRK